MIQHISAGKDLAKRTISDKTLKDRAYEIATNCNYRSMRDLKTIFGQQI